LQAPDVDPEARATILLSQAEALLAWGQQLHLDSQSRAAIESLDGAIETTSDPTLLSQLYETKGRAWLELGDYTKARTAFTQAHDHTPDEPWPLIGRAKAAYFAEDFDAAREDFKALIAAHANERTTLLARVGLGLVFEHTAQAKKAAKAFSEALADPITAHAYLDRYEVFSEFRAYEHAETDLRQALKLDPESPEVLNLLAWISTEWRTDEAHLRESVEFAKRSIELEGSGIGRGNYLDTLGWILHLLKQDQDALPYLQQAVALADYDQQIRYHNHVVEKALQEGR
jgi:Tfp pilus assembly protein PilF